MIVFESGAPVVRVGETEIAGRRVAARAVPYVGEAGPPLVRFDPIAARVVVRPARGTLETGPADAEAWRRAVMRAPAGPVLVGPAATAEAVRGAALGAALGARAAGRPVYLLDPSPAALPDAPGEAFVALFAGLPDEALLADLRQAAGRMPAGLLLPVLPGWTSEDDFLEQTLPRVSAAGAAFLAPVRVDADGESRRRAVEARAALDPASLETYFERVHHGDWEGESAAAAARIFGWTDRLGLSRFPPRPRADGEPAANASAASRLEELAGAEAAGEHVAARLRAAVRWIDELGRDLALIVEEGNFHKIFPFGAEIAAEVSRAVGAFAR